MARILTGVDRLDGKTIYEHFHFFKNYVDKEPSQISHRIAYIGGVNYSHFLRNLVTRDGIPAEELITNHSDLLRRWAENRPTNRSGDHGFSLLERLRETWRIGGSEQVQPLIEFLFQIRPDLIDTVISELRETPDDLLIKTDISYLAMVMNCLQTREQLISYTLHIYDRLPSDHVLRSNLEAIAVSKPEGESLVNASRLRELLFSNEDYNEMRVVRIVARLVGNSYQQDRDISLTPLREFLLNRDYYYYLRFMLNLYEYSLDTDIEQGVFSREITDFYSSGRWSETPSLPEAISSLVSDRLATQLLFDPQLDIEIKRKLIDSLDDRHSVWPTTVQLDQDTWAILNVEELVQLLVMNPDENIDDLVAVLESEIEKSLHFFSQQDAKRDALQAVLEIISRLDDGFWTDYHPQDIVKAFIDHFISSNVNVRNTLQALRGMDLENIMDTESATQIQAKLDRILRI